MYKIATSSVVRLGYEQLFVASGDTIMRLTVEALSVHIVVHRVGAGMRPFAWAVRRTDTETLIHVSPERFASMEAACRAGNTQLGAFIPKQLGQSDESNNREWKSRSDETISRANAYG